jgi:hypothetical protein
VVAEATSVLAGGRLHEWVGEFHRRGLFLFTWGDANNDFGAYMAQKEAGIGGLNTFCGGGWLVLGVGDIWVSGRAASLVLAGSFCNLTENIPVSLPAHPH